MKPSYVGRLAPTPSGSLHLGHALTFLEASRRAREAQGTLLLRIEDLDEARCLPAFTAGILEDLAWLGISWHGTPLFQSQRREAYLLAWRRLRDGGFIYPCQRSRKDVAASAVAPHEESPIFPLAWRGDPAEARSWQTPTGINWRFRVPDECNVSFVDGRLGSVTRRPMRDFGDFVVWNRSDVPAYELAVVVDDIESGITEVVRGEDLLTSTARQLLIYRALAATPPCFYHTPLLRDASGMRLAKRSEALSLRQLRESGVTPASLPQIVREQFSFSAGGVHEKYGGVQ